MREIVLISTLLIIALNLHGQKDTLRKVYENGNARFAYPTLDGEYHGLCRMWHKNGQLQSEGKWINGKQDGLQVSYFDNGNISLKAWYVLGKLRKSKAYHENGNKSLFSNVRTNGLFNRFWYESGERLMKHREIKGRSITCSSSESMDGSPPSLENETCYCGDIKVYRQDTVFVDSLGVTVNQKMRLRNTEWFESGGVKSRTTLKNGFSVRKEWDEEGEPIVQ
ncbi:MAG: hypothetical protein ACI9AT_000824 [Ulvibacter sp.]|jgi:hypothetical protein